MKRDMGLHIHWEIVNESEANEDSKWFRDVGIFFFSFFFFMLSVYVWKCDEGFVLFLHIVAKSPSVFP